MLFEGTILGGYDRFLTWTHSKQQTLTQLFAGQPESSSAEYSTDDDAFVTPSKIKRTHDKYSLVTPPSAKKKRENKQLGEPAREGDLVTSTAAELNHPRLLFGDIGEGYIFFGIVLEGDQTALKVSWSSVELGHQKARVIKKRVINREIFLKTSSG